MASIMWWQAPQSPPARQASVTSSRELAPRAMAVRTSESVTALQMQMNMLPDIGSQRRFTSQARPDSLRIMKAIFSFKPFFSSIFRRAEIS
ncbi:MAG TPA: hypothetical protein VNO21_13250, partial [Polyangiaceae bacterium]|nr:hypothetical protein [Polyangiaceae bacterium]